MKGTVSKVSKRPTARASARAVSFPFISTAGIVAISIDSEKLHFLHHLIGKNSAWFAALAILVLGVVWMIGFRRWLTRNDS